MRCCLLGQVSHPTNLRHKRHSGWVCMSDWSNVKYKRYKIIPIQQMVFIETMIQRDILVGHVPVTGLTSNIKGRSTGLYQFNGWSFYQNNDAKRHSGWVCTSDWSIVKYKRYRLIPIHQTVFIKNMIQDDETK